MWPDLFSNLVILIHYMMNHFCISYTVLLSTAISRLETENNWCVLWCTSLFGGEILGLVYLIWPQYIPIISRLHSISFLEYGYTIAIFHSSGVFSYILQQFMNVEELFLTCSMYIWIFQIIITWCLLDFKGY